jgi:hypothetical protein
MTEPTGDERWTQIRYDYEHTDRPIVDICAEHGISANTLRDRVRRWGWTKRRAPISREGPPAMATPRIETEAEALARFTTPRWGEVGSQRDPGEGVPAIETPEPPHPNPLPKGEREQTVHVADVSPSAAPTDADPATIAPRLQSAVARVLPAIEAIIAQLGTQPLRPREMEQTARALGALTRTLRELNALLAQHPPRADEDDDPVPEDIDEFRYELARRIRAFIAARRDNNSGGGATDETPA